MTIETGIRFDAPLYQALVAALPIYVKEPFAAQPRLDVRELASGVGRSHETAYRWLRGERPLNARNVNKIVERANRPDNVAILTQLDRTPPTREDFTPFLFA